MWDLSCENSLASSCTKSESQGTARKKGKEWFLVMDCFPPSSFQWVYSPYPSSLLLHWNKIFCIRTDALCVICLLSLEAQQSVYRQSLGVLWNVVAPEAVSVVSCKSPWPSAQLCWGNAPLSLSVLSLARSQAQVGWCPRCPFHVFSVSGTDSICVSRSEENIMFYSSLTLLRFYRTGYDNLLP